MRKRGLVVLTSFEHRTFASFTDFLVRTPLEKSLEFSVTSCLGSGDIHAQCVYDCVNVAFVVTYAQATAEAILVRQV